MKQKKSGNFLRTSRKYFFTLALFLLVFGVASVVKIQAAGNVTGWLWGGSEDANIVGPLVGNWPPDGNETSVGMISMSGSNYSVTIPSSSCFDRECELSGYGWANAAEKPGDPLSQYSNELNGLGWIDFKPSPPYPTENCDGTCPNFSARRKGDIIEGWARFVSIKNAYNAIPSNSGGWQGWIKMKGANYGVDINKMDGTGNNPTFAWSNELGWIDFSHAKVTPEVPPEPTCSISCPTYITIPPGGTDSITCNVSGCEAVSCTDEGVVDIIAGTTGEPNFVSGSCQVTISPTADPNQTTTVRTHTNTGDWKDTTVRVKRAGWNEAPP